MTEKQRKERFYENHLQALGTVSVPVHALRPSGLLRRAIRLFRSGGDHPRPDRVLRRRGESLSVTVTTYNQNGEEAEQTFTKCPERVVSISQANTEMLVSLGLSDLIVATAHRTSTPWPETAAEYESLNFLAMDDYPSKEVVLSLEPDLIVGWGSLFADDALGATSRLE